MATSQESIAAFDISNPAQWETWLKTLESYFDCHDIVDPGKKKAHLVRSCGIDTVLLLKDLIAPKQTKDESYTVLVKALIDHLSPKPTMFAERMDFFVRVQGPDEFLAGLRRVATRCSFPHLADTLLNQFLLGLREPKLWRKLVSQDDLDLDKTLREAAAYKYES